MPNNLVKDIHKQTGRSTKSVDTLYKKEEEYAKKKGVRNPYAYATSVVDKITGYKPHDKK